MTGIIICIFLRGTVKLELQAEGMKQGGVSIGWKLPLLPIWATFTANWTYSDWILCVEYGIGEKRNQQQRRISEWASLFSARDRKNTSYGKQIRQILRKTKFDVIKIALIVGINQDAAQTALAVGLLRSISVVLFEQLAQRRNFPSSRHDNLECTIDPDFSRQRFALNMTCILRCRLGTILYAWLVNRMKRGEDKWKIIPLRIS